MAKKKLSSKSNYVPNRMINEIEVERNGKTTYIDGANVLDGMYVKKGVKYAKGSTVKGGKFNLEEFNDWWFDGGEETADEEYGELVTKALLKKQPSYPNEANAYSEALWELAKKDNAHKKYAKGSTVKGGYTIYYPLVYLTVPYKKLDEVNAVFEKHNIKVDNSKNRTKGYATEYTDENDNYVYVFDLRDYKNAKQIEKDLDSIKGVEVQLHEKYAKGGGIDSSVDNVDDWFWNYDYRHYLRGASDKKRKEVKDKFIKEGLVLNGSSPKHAYIVVSTINPSELKHFKKVGKNAIKFGNGGGVAVSSENGGYTVGTNADFNSNQYQPDVDLQLMKRGGAINSHYEELYRKANNNIQGALELYAGELGIYNMFYGHKVDATKKAKVKSLQAYLENKYSKYAKGSTVKGGLYEVWYTLENEKIANKRKFRTEEEANDFYDNLLEEKEFNYVVALDLLYGGRQLRSWNVEDEFAKGGGLKKKANYVPNYMVQSVEVERKGKTTDIDGADIYDGFYVKKGVKFAKGGGVDTELKEALGIADGGGVFTQDFFDKYELVKETYSTKKNPNADELAKNRKKELQEQGFLVKMRKVSFEDLARSVGYFIIAVKRKNETYAKGSTVKGKRKTAEEIYEEEQYNYMYNSEYAKGGGVGEEFYVGQSIMLDDKKPHFRRLTKDIQRLVRPYYNVELVIEEIIPNKPYNFAKTFVKSNGKKVPFEIKLNEKQIQQYGKGGGVGNDDTPKVWIGEWSLYNEGKLIGEWVDLSDYSSGDEVMDKIQELLDKWTEETGDNREEYGVFDFENFPRSMYSEQMGEQEFDNVIKAWEFSQERDVPMEVIGTIVSEYSPSDIGEWFDDHYEGQFDSNSDLAYHYVDMVGGLQGLGKETVERYFDYDSFGRDLAYDYTEYDGHYFRSYKRGGTVGKFDLKNYLTKGGFNYTIGGL